MGLRPRALVGDRRIESGEIDQSRGLRAEDERIIGHAFLVELRLDREVADALQALRRGMFNPALEQVCRHQIAGILQATAHGRDAPGTAAVIAWRPVIPVLHERDR